MPLRQQELSIRYVTDKILPDKAIDIIDEASATANIDGKSRDYL